MKAKKENKDPNIEYDDEIDALEISGKNEIVAGVQDSIESFKFSHQTSLLQASTTAQGRGLMAATSSKNILPAGGEESYRSKHTNQNTIGGLSTIRNRY